MISPTPLAVVLAVIGAPIALLIGVAAPAAWPLGLVWIALIGALIVGDAILAANRRTAEFTFEAENPAYIGSPIETKLRVAFRGASPRIVSVQLETNTLLASVNAIE